MPVVLVHKEGEGLAISGLNASYDLNIIHEIQPLRSFEPLALGVMLLTPRLKDSKSPRITINTQKLRNGSQLQSLVGSR